MKNVSLMCGERYKRKFKNVVEKKSVTSKLFIVKSDTIEIRVKINNASFRIFRYFELLPYTKEKQCTFFKIIVNKININTSFF